MLSLGYNLKAAGNKIPKPPSSSLTPINRIKPGISLTYGMADASSSIGVNVFIKPAMRNMPPNIIWATQSMMLRALTFRGRTVVADAVVIKFLCFLLL
jgi:hypothetical protein